MRKNPTPEEKKIWFEFFRKIPVRIRRQVVIDDYIVDFYCPRERIVIEIDGLQHCTMIGKQKDGRRDAHLSSLGMKVLRFSNIGVNTMFFLVCREIYAALDPIGDDFLRYFPEEKKFYDDYRRKLIQGFDGR